MCFYWLAVRPFNQAVIRDAIFDVCLIYRVEPLARKWEKRNTKSKNGYAQKYWQ